MKKIISISFLILIVLVGCKDSYKEKLDTSKLRRIKIEGVTKEVEKVSPILYSAPSIKAGLQALPFQMKLPDTFPFDTLRYYEMTIQDFKHDGKVLRANFFAFPIDKNSKIEFKIQARHPAEKNKLFNVTEIKLDDDVKGEYKGNTLYFKLNNVSYSIIYRNTRISAKQHKEQIVEVANQIINN